jgi:predicted ribosome quality control (RQC) complex YloA/Tae2 family protein
MAHFKMKKDSYLWNCRCKFEHVKFQTSYQKIDKIYSNQSITFKIYSKHIYKWQMVVKSKRIQRIYVKIFPKIIHVMNVNMLKTNIFNS